MARQFLIGTPFGALGVDDGEDGREYIGVGIGIDEGTAAPTGPIAFRSLTSTTYAIRTNTVLTAPAGLADGDILIAVIVVGRNAVDIDTFDPVPPAGWAAFGTATKIGDASTFTGKLHIWWKRASSESGSYTFTHNSVNTQGLIKAYSGCLASGTPLGATANATGSGTTSTGTSITTTAANSYLLYEAHNWTGTARLPASGMTERFDNLLYSADELIAAASSTGTRVQNPNGNSGGGDVWAVRMVELLAYTGAPPPEAFGTLTATLGNATLAATGTVSDGLPPPAFDDVLLTEAGDYRETETGVVRLIDRTSVGVLAATLAPATVSATGKVLVRGTLAATLGSATLSSTGKVFVAGTLTTTLDAATTSAAGKVLVRGGLTATLGAATLSATGKVPILGQLPTTTLANATVAGAGTVNDGLTPPPWDGSRETEAGDWRVTENDAFFRLIDITSFGILVTTLSNAALGAAGTVLVRGSLTTTLGPATLSATGTAVNKVFSGTLTATLAPATLTAAGVIGAPIPPPFYDGSRETEDDNWRETEDGNIRIIDRIVVGVLSATLAPATLYANGTVNEGLPPPDMDGVRETEENGDWRETEAGTIRIIDRTTVGSLSVTLAPATLAATGTVTTGPPPPDQDGVRETEGGDFRETEAGIIRIVDRTTVGVLSVTLAPATLFAAGTVYTPAAGTVFGSLHVALNSATLVATGTVTTAPENFLKVWTGSAWAEKPAKVWTGSMWVEKPVKVWDGSAWVRA